MNAPGRDVSAQPALSVGMARSERLRATAASFSFAAPGKNCSKPGLLLEAGERVIVSTTSLSCYLVHRAATMIPLAPCPAADVGGNAWWLYEIVEAGCDAVETPWHAKGECSRDRGA